MKRSRPNRIPPPGARTVAASLLLLLTAGVSRAQPPEAQAETFLLEQWRASHAPAVSVAVAYRDRIVFARGFGFADLDNLVPATSTTVYNIGSVSKLITAVAVLQLVEAGRVGLDDPIQRYVPAFPEKAAPITIRHLLTHTSGIRHYRDAEFAGGPGDENVRPFASFDEAIGLFKDDTLLFRPGTFYHYSSYGVNLLQGMVEKASGLPFETYLIQHVWGPAGMLRTAFDVPGRIVPGRARGYALVEGRAVNSPYGDLTYKFASGGMLSTVEDLVRFGAALNHGRLLSAELTAQMLTPHREPVLRFQAGGPPTRETFEQALMWRVRSDDTGRTFAYHCGTVKGYNACLVDYVSDDLVIAMADNAEALGFAPAVRIAQFFLASPPGD
jgi:serine beta-lactamase-like protein LACTB